MAKIDKLQIKRGLAINVPALNVGEFGLTTDTEKLYVGAGSGNIEILKRADLTTHNDEYLAHLGKENMVRSNQDENGVYLTIERFRSTGTKFYKSELSGGVAPLYTTRTVTLYNTDGITVVDTYSYTITYNTDESVLSETLN